MNKFVWAIAILVLIVPLRSWSQQGNSTAGQNQDQSSSSASSASSTSPASAPHQDSLVEAARKAREQKKNAGTQAKVITNDNLPTSGGISTVGGGSTPAGDNAVAPAPEGAGKPGSDEKKWRDRFAELRHKLEQDQATLDVDQRELGELNTQFYSDPMKGMQQGLTRSDINDKVAEIDKMKAQVAADQKAIDDAEDDLRKSGGDPGWAR